MQAVISRALKKAAAPVLPARYEPGVGAQACSPCNPGFYKAFKDCNACQACTANATSLAGSVAASDCGCVPGFEGTFDTGCVECPIDFYRDTGDAACRPCPLNSGTPGAASSDSTACVCRPGFSPKPPAALPVLRGVLSLRWRCSRARHAL
jgi:hypothetical protein